MVSGAFLVFDVLLSSYRLWPVNQFFPQLSPLGIEFFAGQFGFDDPGSTFVSAPVLICLFLIDFGMGVINRFAQNMNVMAIATPIKSLCATLVLLLMLGMIVESVLRQVGESGHLLSQLNHLFGVGNWLKKSDQTEKPTEKRVRMLVKGQVHRSQDLSRTLVMMVWLLLLPGRWNGHRSGRLLFEGGPG